MTTQYSGMGMHMTYNYYNNSTSYYGSIINLIIIFLVIMIVVITLGKILTISGPKKCKKCGLTIDSEEWQICPRCGNPLKDGSVDKI